MELTTFRQRVSVTKNGISPYKIIRLDELRRVEEDVYSVDGVDVRFTPKAQRSLIKVVGTSKRQLETVKKCSGEAGRANFQNYLTVAANISQERQVVLVADKASRIVTDVIVPVEEFIPAEAFFDFTELFVEHTHTEVEKIERSLQGDMDIRVYFKPSNPIVMSLGEGEDFITNGMYLQWNGSSIVLGNYFVRLVCMNGQTMQIHNRTSVLYSMKQKGVDGLLAMASSNELITMGFMKFKEEALEAMSTIMSLWELGRIYELLTTPEIELPAPLAASIVPYHEKKEHFMHRGIDVAGREKLVKTDVTWWQLYNKLTNFATHTTELAPDDIVRGRIIKLAMLFIGVKHNIENYIEYE